MGEIVSRPTPDNTIMVRLVPDTPSTMEEVPISALSKIHKTEYKYVHYAKLVMCKPPNILGFDSNKSWGLTDLLRHDYAAPVSFDFYEIHDELGISTKKDCGSNLVIGTVSMIQFPDWSTEKWLERGWEIRHLSTLPILDAGVHRNA